MLTLTFYNMTVDLFTGSKADYNVYVKRGVNTIAEGKVKGHTLADGWKVLVQKFLDDPDTAMFS